MPDDGPAVRRLRLGAMLRRRREELRLTGDEAGRAVAHSASWISRVEAGRTALRPRDLSDLLDLYRVHGPRERAEYERLIGGERQQGWWSRYRSSINESYARYIGLESDATSIQAYENAVVHGLMQTASYARAQSDASVLDFTRQEVDDRVAIRQQRQQILRRPDPPKVLIVMEEAALSRVIGERQIMIEQLDALIRVCHENGSTQLRVIPGERAIPTLGIGTFGILRFRDAALTTVYIETATGGTFEEGEGIQTYERLFERLREIALDHEQSAALMEQVRTNLVRGE